MRDILQWPVAVLSLCAAVDVSRRQDASGASHVYHLGNPTLGKTDTSGCSSVEGKCGTMDVSQLLPFGTEKEIADQVVRNIQATDGRIMIGSSTEVNNEVPLENYLALHEAVLGHAYQRPRGSLVLAISWP